ncbi:hypothetical protein HFO93_00220 [Rhizobium leguminosarum]|uniref:DUF5677 domain-containing protein n=1 Tax=Rhizobium leguminosarum TaxID=384 RepID=UPI001C987660|nr:DUF5677 domain-containing protein [Rhizobium leguminosarum]MBY5441940.1 hypothetical protein [Rhizobium leguminosarum]
MAKKPAKPDVIKQEKFKDRNLTMLSSLPRDKGTVQNVFKKLGQGMLHPVSWFDECVPNLLWAAIAVTTLDRDAALVVFREVVRRTIDFVEKRKELFVTHNYLALATNDEFDAMMSPVLESDALKNVMGALLISDWLPDRRHWARHYAPLENEASIEILMAAVANTHGHQSERATDMRWLKLLSFIFAQERMFFDRSFEEAVSEISEYPNKGEMQSVRPTIRAMEMGTRTVEFGTENMLVDWPADRPKLPTYDAEPFWKEMHAKTPCLVPSHFKRADAGPKEARQELLEISKLVGGHFHRTITTTKADPRHEGAFGLVLYACHLALTTAITPTNTLAEGRIILRTILEAFITLHYLTVKDDATIWLQYRKYGQGQTKLAFLKNVREEEIPGFIDLDELESFANEDRWMELEDIELGHWANLNLRKMSEEVGLRDLYDKYYDWSSGYVHGQWASARSTVYINCFNPLHRFHRVPGVMGPAMPSTLVDIAKIVNRMLDDLNALYPSFKARLSWHKKVNEEDLSAAERPEQNEFADPVLGEETAVKR